VIFARYLLKQYLKVLILAVFSFIALLLVSQLKEIAQFAAMGAPTAYLLRFILYQIPYILPIAIPVSCLISATLLFQNLSHTHQLTALRSSGISLLGIMAPIILAGLLLSCINFYITSEIATESHLATRKMAYEFTSINPLLILQKAQGAKLKGAYVQMEPLRSGEAAEKLVLAWQRHTRERLLLLLAKKIEVLGTELRAHEVTLISSMPGEESLLIENQREFVSSAPDCAQFLKKKGWKISNDHLKFCLLQIRMQEIQSQIKSEISAAEKRHLKSNLSRCYTEIVRRFSMGIACFTFTLVGIAFGIDIGRWHSKKGILLVFALASFALITFFMAKECDHLFWLATPLFMLPHALIATISIWKLNRIYRGIE
jgi:lipopolysaccharide export system permease protein